jgi:hypothetical protein
MATVSCQPVSQNELQLTANGTHYGPIDHADFVYALSHIDTFVDINGRGSIENL